MDVSIIIVNYNTKELTQKCLASIFEHTRGIVFEVIVSDNGSTDGSIELIKSKFSQVILLENNINLGFGAANNRGLAVAKGKYVFYLNSDTVLLNNAVKFFFDFFENKSKECKIGALGGILLDENYLPIHSGAPFPTYISLCKQQLHCLGFHIIKSILQVFHLKQIYLKKQKNFSLSVSIQAGETQGDITGADLFLLNNQYAYFDERYFMYLEETDLELKLKKNGFKFFLLSEPRIQHLTRKIDEKNFIVKFSEICIQNSSVYYAKKNFNSNAFFLRFLILLDRLNPYLWKMIKRVSIR